MVQDKVKTELKRLLGEKQVEELSKQLNLYEKRVREAVKQFDLKGREAKLKGQQRLEKFSGQLKRTRQNLEKHFKSLASKEGKILNRGLQDLFGTLRTLAKREPPKRPVKRRRPAAKKKSKAAAQTAS